METNIDYFYFFQNNPFPSQTKKSIKVIGFLKGKGHCMIFMSFSPPPQKKTSLNYDCYTPKFNIDPEKMVVGRRSFPIWVLVSFHCYVVMGRLEVGPFGRFNLHLPRETCMAPGTSPALPQLINRLWCCKLEIVTLFEDWQGKASEIKTCKMMGSLLNIFPGRCEL